MPHRSFIAGILGSLVAGLAAPVIASAQFCPPPAPAVSMPLVMTDSGAGPANPADVGSIDSIVSVIYSVISGPAGQKRDWNRFKSLFLPGARLIPTGPCRVGGPGTAPITPAQNGARSITPAEYAARAANGLEKNGFFEREIARHTDTYGDIAQVFTTYESRHKAEDPQPFARGINSMQFFNDGKRWWVVTIFWDAEGPDNPIPAQYLPR